MIIASIHIDYDPYCDYKSKVLFRFSFDVLPTLDPRVRWLLCVLWNPPNRANADRTGNTPLAAQNLNTAGGDTPAFGCLLDR